MDLDFDDEWREKAMDKNLSLFLLMLMTKGMLEDGWITPEQHIQYWIELEDE